MDMQLSLPALAPPLPGQLCVLIAPRRVAGRLVNLLVAQLALSGEVQVLDGGNLFDAHAIARFVRRQTPQLTQALKRISIVRAFTCYQVAARLAEEAPGTAPLLVLDMLATFGDENVPAAERLALLKHCLGYLRRLADDVPTLISAAPSESAKPYLARLEQVADRLWRLEPAPPPAQPRLFGG
jgi:hypothetical protein